MEDIKALKEEIEGLRDERDELKVDVKILQEKIEALLQEKERAVKDRQKKIEELFHSTLNFGYNYALNNEIKEALHDPSSFEHIKTVYLDKGDHLLVWVTFRAKNQFGAFVVHEVQAAMDLDGVILAKAMVE